LPIRYVTWCNGARSVAGQTEKSRHATGKSVLPSTTDVVRLVPQVRLVPTGDMDHTTGGRQLRRPLLAECSSGLILPPGTLDCFPFPHQHRSRTRDVSHARAAGAHHRSAGLGIMDEPEPRRPSLQKSCLRKRDQVRRSSVREYLSCSFQSPVFPEETIPFSCRVVTGVPVLSCSLGDTSARQCERCHHPGYTGAKWKLSNQATALFKAGH
jgi:hypothetical protein